MRANIFTIYTTAAYERRINGDRKCEHQQDTTSFFITLTAVDASNEQKNSTFCERAKSSFGDNFIFFFSAPNNLVWLRRRLCYLECGSVQFSCSRFLANFSPEIFEINGMSFPHKRICCLPSVKKDLTCRNHLV